MNDSRVIPARLFGTRRAGGSVEVVLLRDLGGEGLGMLTVRGAKRSPERISPSATEATAGEVIRAEVDGWLALHFQL